MQKDCYGLLITQAFEKAKELLEREGERVTVNSQGEKLHEMLRFKCSSRSLINRKKDFEVGKKVKPLKSDVTEAIAKIVGHDSYDSFRMAHGCLDHPKVIRPKYNRSLMIFMGIMFFILMGWSVYSYINRERWMVWENDHYVEVSFDEDLYKKGSLKMYDERLIEQFFKRHPDSIESFFDLNKKAIIFYGRNAEGELEYFTLLDDHPETGKALDPITSYMIKKYIEPRHSDSLKTMPLE